GEGAANVCVEAQAPKEFTLARAMMRPELGITGALRFLGARLRPHWIAIAAVLLALSVEVAFDIVFPLGFKWLIDGAITREGARCPPRPAAASRSCSAC